MSLVVSGKSLTSTCSGLTMVAGNTTILWDLGQFHGTWASFRVMGLGPISFMGLGHATHQVIQFGQLNQATTIEPGADRICMPPFIAFVACSVRPRKKYLLRRRKKLERSVIFIP